MQVQGGREVTLAPCQTFYEGPSDVHLVGRNASRTQPARFLAVLVKTQRPRADAHQVGSRHLFLPSMSQIPLLDRLRR